MIHAHAHHKAPPNTNVVIVKMSTTPPSTPSKRRKGRSSISHLTEIYMTDSIVTVCWANLPHSGCEFSATI